MKVAVCLTGLCNIDPSNINKVFHVFDHLRNTKGIQFDFYMQYWNNNNHYFYELSNTLINSENILKVPTLKTEIYSKIISHIKPKEILGLNFTDVVLKSKLDKNIKYTRDENNVMAVPYNGPSKVDIDTFKNKNDINIWCEYHASYVDFINQRAQFYSLQEIVNVVPKNEYDIILKWRYDILTDYTRILEIDDIKKNTIYVPGLFRKKTDKPIEEIRSLIAKNRDYTYAILDMWMYGNEKSVRKLCDDLLHFSIANFDESTRVFRETHDTAAPMDESAFLDKILHEKMIVKPVGACDTRIIHPNYNISDLYFENPTEELKNMQVDCDYRYSLLKEKGLYARGNFGSENQNFVRGGDAFIHKPIKRSIVDWFAGILKREY